VTRVTYEGECPSGGTIDDWLLSQRAHNQQLYPHSPASTAGANFTTAKSFRSDQVQEVVRTGGDVEGNGDVGRGGNGSKGGSGWRKMLTPSGDIVAAEFLSPTPDGHFLVSGSRGPLRSEMTGRLLSLCRA
jgi:hypothetical protein